MFEFNTIIFTIIIITVLLYITKNTLSSKKIPMELPPLQLPTKSPIMYKDPAGDRWKHIWKMRRRSQVYYKQL
jgi:hypothetical protein